MVSDLQEAVDSVGPAKIAQAEAKAIRELKRDVEATTCWHSRRKAVENGAGTPNALRGLGDWLDSAGPADVPASFRTPADKHRTQQLKLMLLRLAESALNGLIISSIFKRNWFKQAILCLLLTLLFVQDIS